MDWRVDGGEGSTNGLDSVRLVGKWVGGNMIVPWR